MSSDAGAPSASNQRSDLQHGGSEAFHHDMVAAVMVSGIATSTILVAYLDSRRSLRSERTPY
jgi:hypothetical protein